MMRILNVAEKNDAAKNIAAYLSRGTSRKREGFSVFNKIYEFTTYLWNQNCEMVMTSVSGHLLSIEYVGAYRKWQGCHPLSLFDATVVKQCLEENSIKIKRTLEREVKKCNALIVWTDCDREGENIGFEIIQVCQAIKPNIPVHRAKFSEITQVSVQRALQNLCVPDKAMNDAVDVRRELDLRIGAAFTRFQTLRLQKIFPRNLSDMLISYGSCQFPTLGFVVERFLEIEKFVSEPYWKIKVTDVRDKQSVEFRWARRRLFEKLPCQVLLDICLEEPNATVEKVISKPKSKWRPLPLDTVELEKQGSRKLHLSAKDTMKIAEKLYTQGLISYPRTETNIFPKELNLTSLVEQQVNHSVWGNFAQRLMQAGVSPRQGKKSDQAHPPIHPIKYAEGLQGNEAKVYEFVVRHFLACVSSNALGQETIVEIDIAGEKFCANGLQIIERNYLEVYIYEKWSDKEIHAYREGEVFRPTSIEMVEEKTSPPELLTEADLITLMDKHGIGTDATHAEHIDTIKSRQYVGLTDGKHLIPGKLGIGLVMGYDNMGFQMSKPNLRAELENDLKLICEGQKSPQEVLQSQINKYREVFKIAMEKANLIDSALANYLDENPSQTYNMDDMRNPPDEIAILKCPKCGSNMMLKDRKQGTGKYIGCVGFPSCNNAVWFPPTVENVEILTETCTKCTGNPRKLKFKLTRNAYPLFGSEYTTCIGGCDPPFNDMLNIRNGSVKRTRQSDDTGYSSLSSALGSTVISNQQSTNTGTQRPPTALSRSNPSRSVNSSTVQRSTSNRNNATDSRNTYSAAQNGNSTGNQDNWNKDTSREVGTSVTNSNSNWGNISNEAVVCNCNETAVQLTVRKEGPNQGRLFYKCARPQETRCDFFLWASEDSNPRQNGSNRNFNQTTVTNTTTDWGRQTTSNPSISTWANVGASTASNEEMCTCNQPARLLTVQKEGPNKGRQFYGCPKGMASTCNFFKWADDNQSAQSSYQGWDAGNSTSNRGRRRDRGRGHQAPKKPRITGGKRKCGICGTEGHTRKTCPENAMD